MRSRNGFSVVITIIFACLLHLLSGCSGSESAVKVNEFGYEEFPFAYYEMPPAFKDSQLFEKTILDYSNSLDGKTIFIDPGHGGNDRRNTSRDGSIVEADVNLKVALHLRGFLQRSGARVLMSRESDTTITLMQRSEMANNSGADLFISIHHNSTSDKSNYWTNYTSTFYHAQPGNARYSLYDHVAARYVQRDLAYALRNPGSLASFDGTMSDYLIYPGDGFSVLRETNIPAILVECSFYTSRLEEQRLNEDQFNKIEAWGVYIGVAKFFKQNERSVVLSEALSKFEGNDLELVFELNDSSPINMDNIKIYLNAVEQLPQRINGNSSIMVRLENPPVGTHMVRVTYHESEDKAAKPLHRQIVIK